MDSDFLSLVFEGKGLNSKVFSLVRLELLAGVAELGEGESVTYRELKAALELNDGVLYANLKALVEMGYLKAEKVMLENKELEAYRITGEGLEEWVKVREWLRKFAEGEKNG